MNAEQEHSIERLKLALEHGFTSEHFRQLEIVLKLVDDLAKDKARLEAFMERLIRIPAASNETIPLLVSLQTDYVMRDYFAEMDGKS